MTGDLPAAIATQQRAVALDPLHLVNLGNLASFLLLDHRPDEARVHVDKMLSLAPDLPFGLDLMATIHLLQGRPAEARELADRLPFGDSVAMDTSYPKAWYDALIEHALGNREAADAALAQFIAEAGEERPVSVACLYAWRGDNDAAFEWLNRALDRNPELSVQYSWEVWLHPLRDDPRWASLMQRWTGSDYVEKI
jgi:tetratricopeptide (TPR) repeat protein